MRRNIQAMLAVAAPAAAGQGGVTPLDGQFAVTQHAAGANFSVDVAAGHAFVPGTDIANQAVYGVWNDGVVNVTVPSPPASGTEVHRLVLQIEDRFSNNVWTGYTANLNLLADTGSGTPAQPASSITLALISVASGQASVLNANITDQRPMLVGGQLAAVRTANGSQVKTTTLTNDPVLFVPMAANAIYEFRFYLYAASASTTSQAKFAFAAPSGASGSYSGVFDNAGGGAFGVPTSLLVTRTGVVGGTANVNYSSRWYGIVQTAGTPGNLQVQFAEQNLDSSNGAYILTQSALMLNRIG